MPITFVLAGQKLNNINEIGDIFVTRFNKLTTDIFRIGSVSKLIVAFFSENMTQQILTEGKAGNTPYAELLQKRKGGGILNKTGQLLKDIRKVKVSKSGSNKQENIRIIIKNTYATYLQTGTKKMVARPILVITEKEKKKLREIVIQSFTKANQKKFS